MNRAREEKNLSPDEAGFDFRTLEPEPEAEEPFRSGDLGRIRITNLQWAHKGFEAVAQRIAGIRRETPPIPGAVQIVLHIGIIGTHKQMAFGEDLIIEFHHSRYITFCGKFHKVIPKEGDNVINKIIPITSKEEKEGPVTAPT